MAERWAGRRLVDARQEPRRPRRMRPRRVPERLEQHRSSARGGEFTMPPTKVTGSTIAQLNDTCGNLVQITQLARD